jgi:hypothetical protein
MPMQNPARITWRTLRFFEASNPAAKKEPAKVSASEPRPQQANENGCVLNAAANPPITATGQENPNRRNMNQAEIARIKRQRGA